MSDGNIQAARVKLKRAVDDLIERRDHDANRSQPSLYACLVSDLGGGQGEDHSPAKSQPPVWIEAVQLLGDIDTQTRKWCPKPGNTPFRLQSLAFNSWRPQDTQVVYDIARKVNHWCESIKNLINPEDRKYICAACPACGREKVYRKDGAGDVVQQPALKWTPVTGFQCQACEAHWMPEQTLFFSRLLGFDLPAGVLE